MSPQPLEITGTLLKRYIQAVALLYILDPVRGEPTAYSLDHDSTSVHGSFDLSLKRKFLDAIALICAFEKDPSCISAACFDKESPDETTIRIASNGGVAAETLICLEDIMSLLKHQSTDVTPMSMLETELKVLDKIIQLTEPRIQHYIKSLRKSKVPNYNVQDLHSKIRVAMPYAQQNAVQGFLDWFEQLSVLSTSSDQQNLEILRVSVRWAEKARQKYLKFLKVTICGTERYFPRWVSYVFKLGRYRTAARILVKTAIEIPAMFEAINIRTVTAPRSVPFSIPSGERPLRSVLRRIPEITADDTMDNLARIWSTKDPEQLFRDICERPLVVHAELQIVGFYEENRHLKPLSRFIGVSKKCCYMCATFLAYHPGGFSASSCHQKMYLSLPPTTTLPKAYKHFKDLTSQLCVRLERIAREELIERFGLRREYSPADSTAGVTYMGSIDTVTHQPITCEDYIDSETDPSTAEDSGAPLYPRRANFTDI